MSETQASISAWANQTFGHPVSNLSIMNRAHDELSELGVALAIDDYDPFAPEEAADVIIVLMRLFDRFGTDWQTEVDKKMAINRARTWVLDGNGHGGATSSDRSSNTRPLGRALHDRLRCPRRDPSAPRRTRPR